MLRSVKDSASRTAANHSLQQSSFVSFPEEDAFREEIRNRREEAVAFAGEVRDLRDRRMEKTSQRLREIMQPCREAAEEIVSLSEGFAQTVTREDFRGRKNRDQILAYCRLIRLVDEQDAVFRDALLRLTNLCRYIDEAAIPAAKAACVCRAIFPEDEKMRSMLADLIRQNAEEAALKTRVTDGKQILIGFCGRVIPTFYRRASEAADQKGEGKEMHHNALYTLCGELRFAAERLARNCAAYQEETEAGKIASSTTDQRTN